MEYEYRHVVIPLEMVKMLQSLCGGEQRLLKQNEWSQFLIQDDSWEHYSIHRPEPHVLLFRRPLSSREEPPSETSLRADANADIECKIQEEDQQQLSAVDEERRQARSRTGDTFEAKDDTDDECDDENQEEQNDSGDQHDNDGRGGGESKSTSKLTRRHVINAKVSPPLKETQVKEPRRTQQQQEQQEQPIKAKRTRFHDTVAARSPPRVGRSIRFDFEGRRITQAPLKRGRQVIYTRELYTLVSPKRLNFDTAAVVGGTSSGGGGGSGGSGSFGSTGEPTRTREQRLRANIILSSTSAASRGIATPMPSAYSSAQLCLLSFESSLAKGNTTTPTRP